MVHPYPRNAAILLPKHFGNDFLFVCIEQTQQSRSNEVEAGTAGAEKGELQKTKSEPPKVAINRNGATENGAPRLP